MFRVRVRRAVAAALLLAGVVHPLHAQSVRGRLTSDATGSAVAGAVVQLVDSAETERARGMSGERGEFVLAAPGIGRYRLRALRVGFVPALSDVLEVRGDTTVAIVIADVPVRVAGVTTRSSGQCRDGDRRNRDIWTLWEEVELGLLGASITYERQDYLFSTVHHDRTYVLDPQPVFAGVTVDDQLIRGAQPWTSLAPDSVAAIGYVTAFDNAVTFVAPDLAVLLSRGFLDGHCYRVHDGATPQPGFIGLDFEPRTRIRADIAGTFWIDSASRELRGLDFIYTSIPSVRDDTLAGGRVEFLRLGGGAWMMPQWVIRAPVAPRAYLRKSAEMRMAFTRDNFTRVMKMTGLRVRGGDVLEVRRILGVDTTSLWRRSTGAIEVHVESLDSAGVPRPAAGAVVRLGGSRRQAVADSAGIARLERVVEGRYVVEGLSSAEMDLSFAPHTDTVDVARAGVAPLRMRVRDARSAVAATCRAAGERGMIAGIVLVDGVPVDGVRVSVRTSTDAAPAADATSALKTSSGGKFFVCGVPFNAVVNITARVTGRRDATAAVRVGATQPYVLVELNPTVMDAKQP